MRIENKRNARDETRTPASKQAHGRGEKQTAGGRNGDESKETIRPRRFNELTQ